MSVEYKAKLVYGYKVRSEDYKEMAPELIDEYSDYFIDLNPSENSTVVFGLTLIEIGEGEMVPFNDTLPDVDPDSLGDMLTAAHKLDIKGSAKFYLCHTIN